jgi:hypothetical protein
MNPVRVETLLSLLDDEDESIAVAAMKELLRQESALPEHLNRLQEADDPLVRRRIHQLQAVLRLRKNRREFFRKLKSPYVDVPDCLLALHLLWFDNDAAPEVAQIWLSFVETAKQYPLNSLEDLAYFMHKCNFQPQPESTLYPESYCVGVALEKHAGAASLLLVMLREIAVLRPLTIGRMLGEFVLQDENGRLLLPLRNWQIVSDAGRELELWDYRKFFTFAACNLFSAAVNSDSFRYILTLAQALNGTNSDEVLLDLPYPYGTGNQNEKI